jgi:hypothetical protein
MLLLLPSKMELDDEEFRRMSKEPPKKLSPAASILPEVIAPDR